MPPLLCLSPVLLDNSFPRSDFELQVARYALGEIQERLEQADIGLIMTEVLSLVALDENVYSRYGECPCLRDIVNLIQAWILQPHEGIVSIDLTPVEEHDYQPHPAPRGSEQMQLVGFWQDETGKILCIHDRVRRRNEHFIGIACDSAFSGGDLNRYHNPDNRRTLPLVGPDNLDDLADAYEWDLPNHIHAMHVGIDDFERNCRCIGVIRIRPPASGSHFTAQFEGKRSWTLDVNYDPIPHGHLRTLSVVTGHHVHLLKYVLIHGCWPKRVCRLHEYQTMESLESWLP